MDVPADFCYGLPDVTNMAGLDAARDVIVAESHVQPVAGCVVLAEAQGSPHSEILFTSPIPDDVIARANAVGALVTSRFAEQRLR